jgi:hypothetical protein
MTRLSWDTTAPRRSSGERTSPLPRDEDGLVAEEAKLIRIAWDKSQRITPF